MAKRRRQAPAPAPIGLRPRMQMLLLALAMLLPGLGLAGGSVAYRWHVSSEADRLRADGVPVTA
ncbi:hypothetical protein [Micromonospora sp. NPDC005237]|uniref:hypothetical protein n=1 Tax=unclassified Micromonospora TaxID=2617518 RepID=UPI0033ABEC9D